MKYFNRLVFFPIPPSTNDENSAPPPYGLWSVSQLYVAAWTQAQRDYELNRLFNAWYYEI